MVNTPSVGWSSVGLTPSAVAYEPHLQAFKPSRRLNWRAFSVLVLRAQARVKKVRSVLRAHLVRLLETSHQSVRTLSRTNTSLAEELPARTDSAALPAAPLGTIANPVRSTVVYRKIRRHLRVSVHHGA